MTVSMTKQKKIDISDAIHLLTGQRKEHYPFEKNIALSVLCTWLHDPDDQRVLRHAETVAAANVYTSCRHPDAERIRPATKELFARALADPPIASDFTSYFEAVQPGVESIVELVGFFMHCPDNQHPSLNKAFYFIERNGFLDPELTAEDRRQLLKLKRATTSLKSVWQTRARTGPFLWAAHVALPEILELAPDDPAMFKLGTRVLSHPSKLNRYFEAANWSQYRLQERLDPKARQRVDFVGLPPHLERTRPKIATFDHKQLEILSDYQAPPLRKTHR